MSKQSSGQLTDGQLWTWWFISIFVYLLSVSLPSLPLSTILNFVYLCSAFLSHPSSSWFISALPPSTFHHSSDFDN